MFKNMKKYDLIYSLGTDCACASYMNKLNLRICSGPFDWLTRPDFETRMNLILNDFQNFLNLEDIKFLEKDPKFFNDEKCDYYENLKTGFCFYHDFLAGIPLEAQIGVVKEKYNRRIVRFYQKVAKSKKVLFIWLAHNHDTNNTLIKELCEKVVKKLNKNIDFLIIEHDETKSNGEVDRIELDKNILKYRLFTRSEDEKGNPTTLGNEAALMPIFKQYACPNNLFLKQKIIKFFIKLISLFIPVKAWRKKFRSKYSKNKKDCH